MPFDAVVSLHRDDLDGNDGWVRSTGPDGHTIPADELAYVTATNLHGEFAEGGEHGRPALTRSRLITFVVASPR